MTSITRFVLLRAVLALLSIVALNSVYGAESSAMISADKPTLKPIDIPLKTWIARDRPPYGKGPAPSDTKHMRLVHNPDNGRMYFCGGDWAGPGGGQSDRHEMYSYSIVNGDWKQDYPYVGPEGDVQPFNQDETGWAYDTHRKIIWMAGFLPPPGWPAAFERPHQSTLVADLMSFGPTASKWSWTRKDKKPLQLGHYLQYDPKDDTLISFGQGMVFIYDIKSDQVSRVDLGKDANGVYMGDEHMELSYSGMDLKNRKIYIISDGLGNLLQYDMNAKTCIVLGKPPVDTPRDMTHVVWDSVSEVLLYPHLTGPVETGAPGGFIKPLCIYHPDTNTWEKDEMKQPENLEVVGNCFAYDPQQNVFVSIGGLNGSKHFFLYRYSNGKTSNK